MARVFDSIRPYVAVVALLAIAGTAAIFEIAWPIPPCLAVTAIAWWLVSRRDDGWSRAAVEVLLPVTIALAVLTVAVAGVRLFQPTSHTMRAIETQLIGWRIAFKSILEWPVLVAILIGLIVLHRVLASGRLLTTFLAVRRVISFGLVALTAITSFTFFGSLPVGALAESQHNARVRISDEHVKAYEVSLREDMEAVAAYLAGATVARSLPFSLSDQQTLDEWLTEIDRVAQSSPACLPPNIPITVLRPLGSRCHEVRADPTVVVRRLAEARVADALLEMGLKKSAANIRVEAEENSRLAKSSLKHDEIEKQATTGQEWADQVKYLDQQSDELRRMKRQAEESKDIATAVTALVTEGFGALVPGLPALANEYVSTLLSSIAEHYSKPVVREWFNSGGDRLQTLDAVAALARDSVPDVEGSKLLVVSRELQSVDRAEVQQRIVKEVVAVRETRLTEVARTPRHDVGAGNPRGVNTRKVEPPKAKPGGPRK